MDFGERGNSQANSRETCTREERGLCGSRRRATGLFALAICGLVAATPVADATEVILINRNSGACVNVPNGSSQIGTQIVQSQCRGPLDEQWTLPTVTGGFQIVSRLNGLCLEVAGASTSENAAVQQAPCTGGANQTWTKKKSGSWSFIIANHSGKCLAVKDASRSAEAGLVQLRCSATSSKRWTISGSPLPSAWSPRVAFPLVPVAAANLADGRVIVWSSYARFDFGVNRGRTYTAIYDPATGAMTEQLVSNTGHDMFCPGTSMLADGRILVNGGSSSSKTSIFNPSTMTWSKSAAMNIPRGYQGTTLLSSGKVLTLGGSWNGGEGNKHAEIWISGVGWSLLPGVPIDPFIGPDPMGVWRGDNHLWLIAARDDWVFHAGPASQMHWIDANGGGSVVDAGLRGSDPYAINGNAVVYDTGRILKVGGAQAYSNGNASDAAYVIDIRGGPTVPVVVSAVAPMTFARAMANSVVLPNGQVVIVGGMNVAMPFSDAGAILMAELWDPQTQKFTRLSPMSTPRGYHAVALLLLDGRVFVGGGGLCGNCGVNHPDAEILTPPYLLNPDGTPASRPAITSAPSSAAPGGTITVTTDMDVARFALVRMAAATHSVNNDQRRIPLAITGGNASAGYWLPIPNNKGDVLPGNYMLIALDAAGRPSVARTIQIR
jgi:galactose oxidase